MLRQSVLLSVVFGLALHASVFGDIINVPGDQPSIQAAIDAAADGDEIVVAPGTYFENIYLFYKAITLRSSAGPEVTTIDANGGGTVVSLLISEGADALIDGFTITGGIATHGGGMMIGGGSPTVANCTFSANHASISGGGIFNSNSSPMVTGCTFIMNAAYDFGGGMDGGTAIDCTFSDNAASKGGGMNGGIAANCTFSGNAAVSGGGGMANGTAIGCTFRGNTAVRGGGMYNDQGVSTVTQCTFSGNSATSLGGGLHLDGGNLTVTNCTFFGNSATSLGGGLNLAGGDLTVTNCTFSGNVASNGGGIGISSYVPETPTLNNSILWNNSPNQLGGGSIEVSYSDIEGGFEGEGNIDADPLFVDADGPDDDPDTHDDNDYRLDAGSPCIDTGDNAAVPGDVTTDLDGNPRIVDGDGDGAAVVDMGAYEFQGNPCPADFNANDSVGPEDLAQLLGSWGPCAGCPADLNGDGIVGSFDLALMLGAWGSCL